MFEQSQFLLNNCSVSCFEITNNLTTPSLERYITKSVDGATKAAQTFPLGGVTEAISDDFRQQFHVGS